MVETHQMVKILHVLHIVLNLLLNEFSSFSLTKREKHLKVSRRKLSDENIYWQRKLRKMRK